MYVHIYIYYLLAAQQGHQLFEHLGRHPPHQWRWDHPGGDRDAGLHVDGHVGAPVTI